MEKEFLLLSSLTCQKPSTASYAKISAYGFDPKSMALISSYLKNRKEKTIGFTFSESLNILFDVPQGSIQGPTLFLIFIADIFYLNYDLDFTSYADDTTRYICGQYFSSIIDVLEPKCQHTFQLVRTKQSHSKLRQEPLFNQPI